jgi:hypothetical protein
MALLLSGLGKWLAYRRAAAAAEVHACHRGVSAGWAEQSGQRQSASGNKLHGYGRVSGNGRRDVRGEFSVVLADPAGHKKCLDESDQEGDSSDRKDGVEDAQPGAAQIEMVRAKAA